MDDGQQPKANGYYHFPEVSSYLLDLQRELVTGETSKPTTEIFQCPGSFSCNSFTAAAREYRKPVFASYI